MAPLEDQRDSRGWAELQVELKRLSPCGRQVIAAGAGHDVEIDDPATVIAAVRSVLLAHGACA